MRHSVYLKLATVHLSVQTFVVKSVNGNGFVVVHMMLPWNNTHLLRDIGLERADGRPISFFWAWSCHDWGAEFVIFVES